MTFASVSFDRNNAQVMVAIPSENGFFPLKALFATALIACSSTSSQAASVGPIRMDSGSTGVAIAAREQDINPSMTDALDEIKRCSGLTWGQLATIFKVSRRTVHSWANGATVRVAHIGLVTQLLERVRGFQDMPAFKVRDHLLNQLDNRSKVLPEANGEAPILIGDNTPFEHQLELRPGKINIRRG